MKWAWKHTHGWHWTSEQIPLDKALSAKLKRYSGSSETLQDYGESLATNTTTPRPVWSIFQRFAHPALPVKILKSKVIRLHSSRYNSSTALFFLNTFETNKSLLPSRVILASVYFLHPGLVKRTSLPFSSHWVKPKHRKIYKPLIWSRSLPIKSCHFSDSCM